MPIILSGNLGETLLAGGLEKLSAPLQTEPNKTFAVIDLTLQNIIMLSIVFKNVDCTFYSDIFKTVKGKITSGT